MDSDRIAMETTYRRRADEFAAQEKHWAFRDWLLVHVRVATFLLAVAMFILGWNTQQQQWWNLGGVVALAGFFAAVAYQDRVQQQILRNRLLRQINEQAIARLHRQWAAFPDTFVDVPPQHVATATDLDLFGHASLFHLLNWAHTPVGIQVLRDWLLEPASPEEIARRQQAVAELAPHLELRQELTLAGRLLADRGRATERFIAWAESDPWLAARPWLLWPVRVLSAVALLIPVVTACNVVSVDHGAAAFFVVLALNIVVMVPFAAKVHDIFETIHLRRGEVTRYLHIFALMCSMPSSCSELEAVKSTATQLGGGVLRRMRQLNRIAQLSMMRHSAMLFYFVYLPLQFVFLYDFHVLNLLEHWQKRYGRHARDWFLALGKFEALGSLAALACDNPAWTMPEVTAATDRLRADKLGHPLLPNKTRVANDVEVGPAGSFLLVTGSNMSGKSTLLRAIGLNVVLAQAGAPVCADRLLMPPATLATSMRIHDSLEDGVSFYMAELMRLKQIVELAHHAAPQNGRLLLYLLDEILLGTNSKERHLAVVRVMRHLLECGTIGAISTHDLDLATSEALATACRCVHFCETLHDQQAKRPMTFDYRLRPGVATTSNALKLLALVGLDER
jgi:hypothetical protein